MSLNPSRPNNAHMHALWLLVSQKAMDDSFHEQVLASAWLHIWYRDTRHSTRLRRSELVEHEGFQIARRARKQGQVGGNAIELGEPGIEPQAV